jgi:hypothetical protein
MAMTVVNELLRLTPIAGSWMHQKTHEHMTSGASSHHHATLHSTVAPLDTLETVHQRLKVETENRLYERNHRRTNSGNSLSTAHDVNPAGMQFADSIDLPSGARLRSKTAEEEIQFDDELRPQQSFAGCNHDEGSAKFVSGDLMKLSLDEATASASVVPDGSMDPNEPISPTHSLSSTTSNTDLEQRLIQELMRLQVRLSGRTCNHMTINT